MVTVNGKQLDFAGSSVRALLQDASYDMSRIAVELNGEILPKSQYEETILAEGDVLEVVRFVGGG